MKNKNNIIFGVISVIVIVAIVIISPMLTSNKKAEEKTTLSDQELFSKASIESNNIKILKYFYKNYKDIIIGYKLDRFNYKKIHLFKNYDFLDIDINLYPDKYIRKLREDEFILGHNINSNIDYFNKNNVYDNLVCDLKFEDY